MAQPDRIFFSTVYCWRELDEKVVKAHFFSVPGNDEKHLFNIDTKVSTIGDDLTRGFKFVGAGKMASLPETRLKVNVDAFFDGRLEAYALRRPEMSIRMNVVNAKKGDKAVRLCNVLTFDDMNETVDFGGIVFTKRPRPMRSEQVPKDRKVKMENEKTEVLNESGKNMKESGKKKKTQKVVNEKRTETKVENIKLPKEQIDKEANNDAKNPSFESLQHVAKNVDWNDSVEEDDVRGVEQLNELMTSVNIQDIGGKECEEESDGNVDSTSSDEEDDQSPLEIALELIRNPQQIEVEKRILNKLMPRAYTGKVTKFRKTKAFTGRSNYTMRLDGDNNLHLLEGMQIDTPAVVYHMDGVIPKIMFAYVAEAGI